MQQAITYELLSKKLINAKSVLLVSGKSLEKTGFLNKLKQLENTRFTRFSNFSENPTFEEVIEGVEVFKASEANLILAVGGGTAIDLAKLIKYYANIDISADETSPPVNNDVISDELITVPTTFGTGSEATHFAVLYVQGKKFSVADSSILPNSYLIDESLADSLPLHVKASACLDALCQAIESYWSLAATSESCKYAIKAIKDISQNIEPYLGQNKESSRVAKSIAEAAHLAGKAINISKTTAPHAISYTLTSKFNVPHGHAVTLCLRNMFAINEKKSKNGGLITKLNEIYAVLGVNGAIEARDLLNNYMAMGGLETSLQKLGVITNEDINLVVQGVNIERLGNHPVELSQDDLISIL